MPDSSLRTEMVLRLSSPSTRPETLTHSWSKPISWEAPPLPPEDLPPEAKIRWLGKQTKALDNETNVRTCNYYNGEFLRLVDDPNLNPESVAAGKYVDKFVVSFVNFQKKVAEKGFSEDLPIGAVVDFREDTTNFLLKLNERGRLSQKQKESLLAEGRLPIDLIARQKEERKILEAKTDDAMARNVYNVVATISHYLPHFGLHEALATKVTADVSRLAPGIFRLMRQFQKQIGVVEGRGMLHSSEYDKTVSLARNLFTRSVSGSAVAGAIVGALLLAEAPVTVPIIAVAFAAGAIAPSLRPDKIDWKAGVKSLLRGSVPGALYLGAGAFLSLSPETAAAGVSLPLGLAAVRLLSGGLFAGVGIQVGTESALKFLNRVKGESDELCQYLWFSGSGNNLERADKLLRAEMGRGPVKHLLGKEIPGLGKKGWGLVARLASDEEMSPIGLANALEEISKIRLQVMADITKNPTRYGYLQVDLGHGERVLIDRTGFFLRKLDELEQKAFQIIGASDWKDPLKKSLYEISERNPEDLLFGIERKTSEDWQRTALATTGLAFGGALTGRLAGAVGAAMGLDQPINMNLGKLLKNAGVEMKALGAEFAGGGENISPPTSLIRAATDLEGLDLLSKAPKKNPTMMRSAFALVSATGEQINDKSFESLKAFLKTQNLTPADVRAFVTVLDKESIGIDHADPFIDGLRESGIKGGGALAKFIQTHPDFNQQMHRVVDNYGLSGKLYRFSSDGIGLLERIKIERNDADVQLLASGIPREKVAQILARPGEIVQEIVQDRDIVIIRSAKNVVASISTENREGVNANLKLLSKILAGDGKSDYNQELLKASNNPTVSYGEFLSFVAIANREKEGWQMTFPSTNFFYLVKQDVKDEALVRQAMTGDPRAFNKIAPLLKKDSLSFLKVRQFHASGANSWLYDVFDRAKNRANIIERVGFYAKKIGLRPVSVDSVTDPFSLEKNLGGLPISYEEVSAQDIVDGTISIDEAVRAAMAKGGKAPLLLVDQAGVEAQVYPSVSLPKEEYSSQTLRLLEALEGSMQQDYLGGNGKAFLTQLLRKNMTAAFISSAPVTGGSVPAVQLMKSLGTVASYVIDPGTNAKIPLNEFGAPILPGVYHPEKYSIEYARGLMQSIFDRDGAISAESISNNSSTNDPIWVIAETVLRNFSKGDSGKIARMCIDLESFVAVSRALRNQSEKDWMTTYLNSVNTGSRSGVPFLGLNTVAEKTFGADLDNLSMGRKAVVFSLPQGPVSQTLDGKYTFGNNNGINGPLLDENQITEKLISRGRWVLGQWKNKGVISQQEYDNGMMELNVLVSIKRPIFLGVPDEYKSTNWSKVKTVFRTTPTTLSTSAGNIMADNYAESHILDSAPRAGRAINPGVQEILDKYVAQIKYDQKIGAFRGPVGPKDATPGIFPRLELFDPVNKNVVVKPGFKTIVIDNGGNIIAETGSADVFGPKVRLGSVQKLIVAAWLKTEGVDIENTYFDNRPGLATLDGSSFRITNAEGGFGYEPFNRLDAGNKVTIMGSLDGPSCNVAIQNAVRGVATKNPDWYRSYLEFAGRNGVKPYVLEKDPGGGMKFETPLEPDAMLALGSSTYVDTNGLAKFISRVLKPVAADPQDISAFEALQRGMLKDNFDRISPPGGPKMGAAMMESAKSSALDPAVQVFTKTGTTVTGGTAKLINDTGTAITAVYGKNGESFAVFTFVDSERYTGNGYVHVPLEKTLNPQIAWGSWTAKPTNLHVARDIAAQLGLIPQKPTVLVPEIYVIRRGDTLSGIANTYGVSVDELRKLNPGVKDRALVIGNPLKVRPGPAEPPSVSPPAVPLVSTIKYTVRGGDSLGKIAAQYRTTWEAIAQANGLKKDSLIRPGQQLIIPR